MVSKISLLDLGSHSVLNEEKNAHSYVYVRDVCRCVCVCVSMWGG